MVTFNFFDYHNNPIVRWIMGMYNDVQVLTIEDCLPDIMKLRHSRLSYEQNKRSFIGDELRLFYASQAKDFVYVDSDCLVYQIEKLKMHHVCQDARGRTNDGSFFRANAETEWVQHYLRVYETKDVGWHCNYDVHRMFPTSIPVQQLEHDHFFLNRFDRFPKVDTVYYTYDPEVPKTFGKPIWLMSPNHRSTGEITKSWPISSVLPEEVFIEQIRYSRRDPNLRVVKV